MDASSQWAGIPLSHIRLVSEELLASRLEQVKTVREDDNECYRLVKDTDTGEHYLHFASRHLNLSGGLSEEHYHHLMPIDHDDVISFALGAEAPSYPEQWERPFLRNGPHGGYVWYDPGGSAVDETAYEKATAELREKLLEMKRGGKTSETDIKKLFDEAERLFPDNRNG